MSEDDVKDRLSRRFDDEEPDKRDENDQNTMQEQQSQRTQSAWNVESVKNEWKALTAYLPEEMYERYDDEFDRVRYVTDDDWKKDRHYKPLIFHLGMERIADMEGKELEEARERMKRKERKAREE